MFLQDFKNKKTASEIRLHHLIFSTILPNLRHVYKDSIFYLTAKDKENFSLLKLADSPEFEPGTKFNYSNPAYNRLALVMKKTSHMKRQGFIAENIFKPTGMENSKITDGSFPDENVAHGYIL